MNFPPKCDSTATFALAPSFQATGRKRAKLAGKCPHSDSRLSGRPAFCVSSASEGSSSRLCNPNSIRNRRVVLYCTGWPRVLARPAAAMILRFNRVRSVSRLRTPRIACELGGGDGLFVGDDGGGFDGRFGKRSRWRQVFHQFPQSPDVLGLGDELVAAGDGAQHEAMLRPREFLLESGRRARGRAPAFRPAHRPDERWEPARAKQRWRPPAGPTGAFPRDLRRDLSWAPPAWPAAIQERSKVS